MTEPELYKANVAVVWTNRKTRVQYRLHAGEVVGFDEGDFDVPGERPSGALRSLEDVLGRGLFSKFNPEFAGDPEHMSRDELLEIAWSAGLLLPGQEAGQRMPHNVQESLVREIVADYLANQRKVKTDTPRKRKGDAS